MRALMRIALVCVCALLVAECEDAPDGARSDSDADRKDVNSSPPGGGGRRAGAASAGAGGSGSAAAAARESQLLSLAAARRRQLFNDRITQHIHTHTLAQKPARNQTTQALSEAKEANGSINNTPLGGKFAERFEATKPALPMKLYQDSRSRAGFLNNRRKEHENGRKELESSSAATVTDTIEGGILYVPELDEKFDGPDREAIVDPDEEFQVDESSHGVYLLNFTDISNVTDNTNNKIIGDKETKENNILKTDSSPIITNISKENEVTEKEVEKEVTVGITIFTNLNDTTERTMKTEKSEMAKENENQTLFMSDEIYNHFRPLESELRAEDKAKFLFFGQKLSTATLREDNLTNSPLLSASTKSVNFISPPSEKKKYTSRYSATEKTKIASKDEEVNDDTDLSVVKNVIEKHRIRNSVKGPAPARHISLLNAYRKPLTAVSTTGAPYHPEINSTDISKLFNISGPLKLNYRNISRTYRRRPVRLTTADTLIPSSNTTTEKSSTYIYTAVVTSVSITSSMKGQNKTDSSKESETTFDTNGSIPQLNRTLSDHHFNQTESTTVKQSWTIRPNRHRVRIKTTTEQTSTNYSLPSPTPFILVNRRQPVLVPEYPELSNSSSDLVSQPSQFPSRSGFHSELGNTNLSDFFGPRLSLDGILTIDQSGGSNAVKDSTTTRLPSIFKSRRRSTTTTTSTTPAAPPTSTEEPPSWIGSEPPGTTADEADSTFPSSIHTTKITNYDDGSEIINENPKESQDQSDQTFNDMNTSIVNSSLSNSTYLFSNKSSNQSEVPNEEVVIEAEKTYTASYVLAGLGFLPVTAIIVFVLRSVLIKKTKEIDTEYEGYFEDGETKKESPITPVARLPMPLPVKPDQKWEFPRNKLRLQTLLGQGNFGQVWKAEADDLSGHDGLTRLVAVKTIKDTATQKEKQELLHEICIMQKIGTHPNVVTLLACCTEQEPYLLLMEYVMCGKLLTYLRERRSRPDRFGGGGGALTSKDLTIFAYCVARGMDYLASKGIVHRDLAARNVLVDHNKLCKIADFGMSREMAPGGGGEGDAGAAGGRAQRHALPVRWMAPEALLYNVFNHETDVWAYGILLWEIVTLGSTPYASMSGREVLQVVTEGYRLERPAHCKPALYRAMHACWHAAPDQRPPFATIKCQLAELLENEPSEGNYVDLDSFYQDSSVYSDPSAIIPDDGISIGYSEEPVTRFRNASSTGNLPSQEFDARRFGFPPPLRSNFIGSPRMGGFGIRDGGFQGQDFGERKETKLSGSSFQMERERENPLMSRNSFSGGFQRLGSRGRDNRGFQLMSDGGRNKRVPEFECDI